MEWIPELPALMALALLAGFVDAVVGGGGLIQIPALFVLLPETAPATLLGTNKFASIWGTGSAAWHYLRRVQPEWRATLPTAATALLFGFLGARAASLLPAELFRPAIVVLLVAVLLYTLRSRAMGERHQPRLRPWTERWAGAGLGAAIGFYDGILGPGTGSFLVIAFVSLFGFSFLAASASAKVVNVVTNFAALGYFVVAGHVRYEIAIPMAVCNVAGATLGTHLALRKGNRFVRRFFIGVVVLLLCRFAWDIFTDLGAGLG